MASLLNLGPIVSATKGLGFGWLKQQIRWHDYEGSKGNIDWSQLDHIVNTLNGQGIKILFSVVAPPPWAQGGEFGLPRNVQDYADFVGACAARYKGKKRQVYPFHLLKPFSLAAQ